MKHLASFTAGTLFTIAVFAVVVPRPTFTKTNTGWTLEHVPMPACPDDHKRTIDAPERDEVDALTISCQTR